VQVLRYTICVSLPAKISFISALLAERYSSGTYIFTMSFDKTKAIRNAERYLSQGKLRAAIGEYKQIVENDSKDIGTLNMLGDLYAKNAEKNEAVQCFTQVAEHYGNQGFAQKAIAVYNKISRLQPDSLEISAKLAELYQSKGSFSEARQHYTALAEQYQNKGRKIEALAIWKQIAQLDPANTEVYLKIAEAYWAENQKDEAAESFTEAGFRFAEQNLHEAALTAFARALEIRQNDFKALNGFVKAQIQLGYSDEAAKTLEKLLEQQPFNRDILYLLVDCHIDTSNPLEAEKAVVRLVEQEPANYPKFLELVKIYLKNSDLDSATRILSMSSEHLLVGGQAEEFLKWVNEILARNPEQLDALRLLVRYHSWRHDEEAFKQSLERLAEVARLNGDDDEERNALSQLVMVAPQEVEYIKRLREINDKYGYTDDIPPAPVSEKAEANTESGALEFESFALVKEADDSGAVPSTYDFGEYKPSENGNGHRETADETLDAEIIEERAIPGGDAAQRITEANIVAEDLSPSDEVRLQKEIESTEFYVENGYAELAEKSLIALELEFGYRPELQALSEKVRGTSPAAVEEKPETAEPPQTEEKAEETAAAADEPDAAEGAGEPAGEDETAEAEEITPPAELAEVGEITAPEQSAAAGETPLPERMADPAVLSMNMEEFRNELGLEDSEAPDDGDYETHYHMAVAYQEMGLMEEAIKEYQDAINVVAPNDGSRRFFQCANLLGHCFVEKGMPNLAVMWFRRALETRGLMDEEKQGLWYELAHAYEADGDADKAFKYFEKIYAENVDYRDVGKRLERLHVNH
jgi:tetratricopeptide (TPR) repeat protein